VCAKKRLIELAYAIDNGPQVLAPEPMERETGIEPATNSLEGCDSTIELLPRNPQLPANCNLL
jgi:hypothetical protein